MDKATWIKMAKKYMEEEEAEFGADVFDVDTDKGYLLCLVGQAVILLSDPKNT